MNRGSLRLRLLLAGSVSVLVALALSAAALTLLFERHVERRIEAELTVYLDQVIAGLDLDTDGALAVLRMPGDPRFSEPLSGLYWQVQAAETVLRSRSLWDADLALPPDGLPTGGVHRHRIDGPDGAPLLVLERTVTLPARLGGGPLRASAAIDAREVATAGRAFAVDLIPYLGMLAVFLIAAAYAQVAIGLRPLAAVSRKLAAIRAGETRRLGRNFPSEILPLAAEVDALLEAREEQVAKAKARAGDLAHGLKTPLQALAGDVERLRARGEDVLATDIERVATAMKRHVERELARARIAGSRPDMHADIADVVRRIVSVVTRTPAGAALEWSTNIPDGTIGRIDPDDLAEAIGNLAENAARHARTKVSISARRAAGFVTVTVADDGPGIPDERIAEALGRGGQLTSGGDGAGLGLAIVQEIAAACGGAVEIRNAATGLEVDFSAPSGRSG